MKEKIFNNFTLKILSALCALVLWAVIVNIYDPTTGVTVSNVNVQLINTESLTDKDYTYEVVDGGKISVYVSGPKSIITDIKSSDIVATADLSKITAFADYVDIDVKVVKDGRVLTNVEVTPKTTALRLDIENRVTKSFDIKSELTGSVASGYVLCDQNVVPASVKITGASSSVARIAQVKALYDISGATENVQSTVPLTLFDADGNEYADDNLEMTVNEVELAASVGAAKTVPIRYAGTSGQPEAGYVVLKVELSAQEAVLSGEPQQLDQISEIVIPAEALNVSNLSSDRTIRLRLSDYIGAELKVASDNILTVTIKITDANSREFSYGTQNIRFEGLKAGYRAEVVNESAISLIISGSPEAVNSLRTEDIFAYVNLTGQAEGLHTLSVQFKLPQGCTLVGDYTVQVNIEPAATEGESTTEAETDTTQSDTAV